MRRQASKPENASKRSPPENPYERLANAIILQAVKDYRDALAILDKNPGNREAKVEKGTLERFFRSKWYGVLTTLDGEMLIRRLNEEVRT